MGIESPRPDDSRDNLGRLTDKDTAQNAAEAVDQLQTNAQKQADEHLREERDEHRKENKLFDKGKIDRVMRDEPFERFLTEDTERVRSLQTRKAKINALDKVTTDDLMSGSSDIKESGRESARVEEVRTRGNIANIRAKLFGEKPLDK